MEPQSNPEKLDTKLIVKTMASHLDRGEKADWGQRCSHYVVALRLLQKYALDHSCDPIDKDDKILLSKHFEVMRALLKSNTSVGSPIDVDRMFGAIDYFVRTWSSPRGATPPERVQGAAVQAGVLVNMLELALSFCCMALFDHELTRKLAKDRDDVLHGLLDVSSVDLTQLGEA